MRGIYTSVNDIRKQVFAEVAKLSYDYKPGDLSSDSSDNHFFRRMEQIPYIIIPGEVAVYRESVFLEREIVKERMRLAMGLNLRSFSEHAPVIEGAEECIQPEKYYNPPLINIIKFACHKCPDNEVRVTDACQGCLAHPCKIVCPRDAVEIREGRSHIDKDKCVKCGKCIEACQYGAIIRLKRPCSVSCGMNAITSDEYGRAEIEQEKCVKCGMCLANCPFGAIADKAQIFQTIQAIKSDVPVYATIAPAVSGQFGKDMTPDKLRRGFQQLGFEDIIEVAIGADLATISEADHFVNEVPGQQPFMATSCCPAWIEMTDKLYPELSHCVSMALTPMVLMGRLLKKIHPGCKVAFIGPCAAKKLEASRESIRSDIDFVLTYEEVMGMFSAKEVNFEELEPAEFMHGASADGRGFAVSGGVANAVKNCIQRKYPDFGEVKTDNAEGLEECRKMMARAKGGKYDGYLLEGMACPDGCVAGAGTIVSAKLSAADVARHMQVSTIRQALDSDYGPMLKILNES